MTYCQCHLGWCPTMSKSSDRFNKGSPENTIWHLWAPICCQPSDFFGFSRSSARIWLISLDSTQWSMKGCYSSSQAFQNWYLVLWKQCMKSNLRDLQKKSKCFCKLLAFPWRPSPCPPWSVQWSSSWPCPALEAQRPGGPGVEASPETQN